MSREAEIVARSYDAFRRGDVETALAPIGEAFVLEDSTRVPASRIVELELARIPEPALPGTPTGTKSEYVGREGFMEWLGVWLSAFEDWQFVVDRVLEDRGAEGQVLVLGRVGAVARGAASSWRTISATSGAFARASRRACSISMTGARPSKPSGCGSRACAINSTRGRPKLPG
jgi:hypothetical protein